ncbi:keratin-associated protein 10-7-like, partial [Pollicipes pollicipes]|uniref:keratin-associated protein 10-7-like n=1 Tax=Pollicipes pollicipes TaxID=41117 RepID=UPI001884B765
MPDAMKSVLLLLLLAVCGVHPAPYEKPGVCRRRVFIALACLPAETINTCNNDFQCPGTQKCCRTEACVTSCEEPDGPKPGTCPLPSAVEPGYPNCDVDSDCGDDDRKCCRNVDGNTRCSSPKAPEKPGVCRRRFFIALVCSPDEIINTCNDDDSQCPGTQKCCRTQRCVTSCEEPDGPKPGVCPPPFAVEPGNPNCDVDSDCGNDDRKCCKNVDGNTRCSSPEKPGVCRRRFFIALVCSPAEIINTCNDDDSQCPGTQKCCRTQRCVTSCEEPDRPKPGVCPLPSALELGNPNCDVDSDCGDDDNKCCKNVEGNSRCSPPKAPEKPGVCRRRFFIALVCSPDEVINTCNDDDSQCPGTQKCCRTQRCVTSCEEPDRPKPGVCPLPSVLELGNPNCDVDSDCGNNDNKCCKNVEGNSRCSPPKAPEKPGVCRRRAFIALVCSPDEVINTCNDDDSQCPGTQKCCRTQRCVTSCEEPDAPKPGTCPPPSAVERGFPNCDVDSDCGDDDRKCCRNVDGNTRCSSPKAPEKPGVCRRRFF